MKLTIVDVECSLAPTDVHQGLAHTAPTWGVDSKSGHIWLEYTLWREHPL